MKKCPDCQETKPLSAFCKNKATKDGKNTYCRLCCGAKGKKFRAKDPVAHKASAKASRAKRKEQDWALQIKRTYGCTLEQYQGMFAAQEGKCRGCFKHQSELSKRLCVDHDHGTLEIRGLLCFDCNTALGRAKDSPETLRNLAIYLENNELTSKYEAL